MFEPRTAIPELGVLGRDVCCRLTRYGLRELVAATLLTGGACALATWLLWPIAWAFWPVAGVLGLLWLWVLAFFRDPDRRGPQGEGLFVSSADGRVTDVTNLGPDSMLGCEGVQIGVFMNVLDVHVNRSPCGGRIERIVRRRGAFLDARDPHASERNESVTVHMACGSGGKEYPVVVRQIAGLIARRIVTDLAEGQTVTRGQRIGMIKFGSRVEVLLPRELAGQVRVRTGQRVRAGETVLAAAGKEQE